jgi:hypothetical protein
LLAGFVASCKSEDSPTKSPTTGQAATTFIVDSGERPVLALTLPPGAEAFRMDTSSNLDRTGGVTEIQDAKKLHAFYIWTIADAKSLDDAVAKAPEVIKFEFIEFKPSSTKDLTVAGAPARQIEGPGKEADDKDDGNAQVILFQLGGHTFAACVHGEGDAPALHREFMMGILQTANSVPLP